MDNSRITTILTLALLLISLGAIAAGETQQTLNQGKVHFSVPSGWSTIMEKSDGDPQAIVIQAPDASAATSADAATITVKTRSLGDPSQFASAVQAEFDRSKSQPGYKRDTSVADGSAHQYFVQRGKTRYLVRDSFFLTGTVAVQVRCQRPLIEALPADWTSRFDSACASVFASLKQARQ
ncbi:MAG: hypothetical protein WBV61_04180 [Rhodanobacteraceae bacterium]